MAGYSTTQMMSFLDLSRKSTLAKATREVWVAIRLAVRGGGNEWQDYSFPKATLQKVNLALALKQGAQFASKQVGQPVNNMARHESTNGMPERAKRIAEAKACIVTAVKHACHVSPATAPTVIMEEFVVLYRKRQVPLPEWVYEIQTKMSRCALRQWIQKFEKRGLRSLAKNQDRRAPRNIVDNTPQFKEFILGMLYEFPHTSGAQVMRGLVARFGPEGKAYDPSIFLPSKRRVQAWVAGWKKGHEQLLLAHVNPDKSRSMDKVAFGDAAAHIYYLNQEWQSDGTLCELMLNDGRRHTLNLTIDVYSRRLKFHVSRTSSAAAVASGQRKCILAWGVCDTWKTDNGSDYKNQYMERFCGSLQILHVLCPPFSPDRKPFVERAFKTFLHSHVEIMQGYLGHSVAERKDIEARRSFADRLYKKLKTTGEIIELNISPEELQRVCDQWAEYVYANEPHEGLDGMTPNQKAAAYDGTVKRIANERGLDMLLLPVPGKGGIRTVRKKGIAITSKQHGLTIKGHYIGTDLTALMSRKVLVRLDDTDLGRVYLFDPHTNEYLGKAEHPGWLGWTQEDVRNVAVAAVRKQKAEISESKKEWRKTAKRADVGGIANEIIETAVRKASKAAPTSAHATVEHITPALEQAGRARTGDYITPTPEEHERAMAELKRILAPEQPTGFVVPENPSKKQDFWQELYEKRAAGEALEEDAERWFFSYAQSPICRNHCLMRGMTPPRREEKIKQEKSPLLHQRA